MAHLTIDERFKIYEMQKAGYSSRYIVSERKGFNHIH